jgi:cytochrome c oxidase subunit 4
MSEQHHIIPIKVYLAVFAALMVLTAVTVYVAFVDMGMLNNVVALGIAVTKATLVVLYFMHMRYNTSLNKVALVATIFFFVLLVGMVFSDVLTRDLLEAAGRDVSL